MTSAADRAVFALWRIAALLRHPRLHWKYVRRMRRIPDLAVPRCFSERNLRRKLHDRDPRFAVFADKLATRRWISERVPGLPVARVRWQGERAEEIPPDLIRPGVAIKANHGSSFNLLIRDTAPPRAQVVETARRWLSRAWGTRRGEWTYAAVPRRVFVEEVARPDPGETLFDGNVHACDGEVMHVTVLTDNKTPNQRARLYEPSGAPLAIGLHGRRSLPEDTALPPSFHEAVRQGSALSRGFDYIRADVLCSGNSLTAGEITVFTAAGYIDFAEPLGSR